MVLYGAIAELLTSIYTSLYQNYIVFYSNSKPIIYKKLLKVLYSYIRSVILFYEKLARDLEAMGFIVNPYGPCVVNKMVNRKQFAIVWNVDDLKLSQED